MTNETRRAAGLVAAAALAFGLAACTPPAPPEGGSTEGGVAEGGRAPVTFTATEYAFDGPASIPGGMTELELVNAGKQSHALLVMRLLEGKTIEDVVALADLEGPLPDWASFPGGVAGIPPGTSARAVLDLEPGAYAIFSFEAEGENPPDLVQGMIQALEVTAPEGAQATAPEADLTVDLTDYSFELSRPLAAGAQTVQFVNKGKEVHEAIVMRVPEGQTADEFIEDVRTFMEQMASGPPEAGTTPEAEEEHEPPISTGGSAPLDPGKTSFTTVDLGPGEYVLACWVPDPEGTPHLMLGMVEGFAIE